MPRPISVYIVDCSRVLRQSFYWAFRKNQEIKVLGDSDLYDAVYELKDLPLKPDIILFDPLQHNHKNSIKAIKELELYGKCIVWSELLFNWIARMIMSSANGKARGYVSKKDSIETILKAISQVLEGKMYCNPCVYNLSTEGAFEPLGFLTQREAQVFILLSRLYQTEEIAKILGIAQKTVHSHYQNMMAKLGIGTLLQLKNAATIASLMGQI